MAEAVGLHACATCNEFGFEQRSRRIPHGKVFAQSMDTWLQILVQNRAHSKQNGLAGLHVRSETALVTPEGKNVNGRTEAASSPDTDIARKARARMSHGRHVHLRTDCHGLRSAHKTDANTFWLLRPVTTGAWRTRQLSHNITGTSPGAAGLTDKTSPHAHPRERGDKILVIHRNETNSRKEGRARRRHIRHVHRTVDCRGLRS